MKIIFYAENDKTWTIYFAGRTWLLFMIYGSISINDLGRTMDMIPRPKWNDLNEY